ncbi:hypothetical protein [Novosphingobium clariflavum]|uniref:Uncharacterized protein n=1 Tax=Novosphingobium clariflavum TaxID=2029884 RepID=A0ABV6S2H2_9SPHN|nr:hypothetical protein [Novosphingobium clariflavum]
MGQLPTFVTDIDGWSVVGAIFKWIVLPSTVASIVSWITTNKNIDAQRERLRREFQLEYAIEAAIQTLLSSENYAMRSFDKIRHHLSGFADDELRRYLIRAGAVRFSGDGEKEMWGLLERHKGGVFK